MFFVFTGLKISAWMWRGSCRLTTFIETVSPRETSSSSSENSRSRAFSCPTGSRTFGIPSQPSRCWASFSCSPSSSASPSSSPIRLFLPFWSSESWRSRGRSYCSSCWWGARRAGRFESSARSSEITCRASSSSTCPYLYASFSITPTGLRILTTYCSASCLPRWAASWKN